MTIIEICALPNGAHRNQTGSIPVIPSGWAAIPDGMEMPDTFPFVDVTAENGVVTGMTAGVVPEPEPEHEPTEQEDTDAMLIDHEYRLTLLELGLTEEV